MVALSSKLGALNPVRDDERTLRVYLPREKGVSTAELYDDDGVTPRWREGAGRLLRLELNSDAKSRATLSAMSAGNYRPAYSRMNVEPIGGGAAIEQSHQPGTITMMDHSAAPALANGLEQAGHLIPVFGQNMEQIFRYRDDRRAQHFEQRWSRLFGQFFRAPPS